MSVNIELSPFADASLLAILHKRGYQLTEYSSILYQELQDFSEQLQLPNKIMRIETTTDSELWMQITLRGFVEKEELPTELKESFLVFAQILQVTTFLAYLDDEPIGGAAIGIYDDVCDLGYTSTLTQFRGRGVQKALLQARLAYAIEQGCQLATVTTEPGSQSQKNVERQGFKMAYTRSKFVNRDRPPKVVFSA